MAHFAPTMKKASSGTRPQPELDSLYSHTGLSRRERERQRERERDRERGRQGWRERERERKRERDGATLAPKMCWTCVRRFLVLHRC